MSTLAKYKIANAAPELAGYDSLLSQLLYNRGLTNEEEIKSFLRPDYDKHRHDPWLLHDMGKAVARILAAIANNEKVAIFSDYDCDGIPGAVILHDFFKTVGHENFLNYIPHRNDEGFGLNKDAIKKLKKDNVDLIITIDCGVADLEEAALAKELGIDLIITDHHLPKENKQGKPLLPEAIAIVNPQLGDTYPFKGLCGAGVIFKLVEALIDRGDFDITPGKEKWWLDMVGIATIADMVPLKDENRVLAHYGLEVLKKSRRPGLSHLLKSARADQRNLTEDDVGFAIAPRINAASRMDTPEDAFRLLVTTDEGEAGAHVRYLEKLNNERKGIVAAMSKELKKRVGEMTEVPSVLALGNPAWRPSLVGLSANSLVNTYDRPTFVWGRDGKGIIKGSCRSNGQVSVIKLMDAAQDIFIEHGGHHMSGGFSVKEESIFHLGEALNEAFASLGHEAHSPSEFVIDAKLTLDDINENVLQTLRQLAPFGTGNEKPLFMFENLVPLKIVQFGKTKEHLKLAFKSEDKTFEAIAFYASPESYQSTPEMGESLTLLAHIEETSFMNRRQTRLRIIDII